jgi:hypothetical protein
MRTSKRTVPFAVLILLGVFLAPTPARAQYVDPGSSSIIIQLLIAGAVGVATVLKVYWVRLTSFFSRRSRQSPPPTS